MFIIRELMFYIFKVTGGDDDSVTFDHVHTCETRDEVGDYIETHVSVDMHRQLNFLRQRAGLINDPSHFQITWGRKITQSWWDITKFGTRQDYKPLCPLKPNYFGGFLIETI